MGCSTSAGVKPCDILGAVFTCTVVLVDRNGLACDGAIHFSKSDSKCRHARLSSVSMLDCAQLGDCHTRWPANFSCTNVGLLQLCHVLGAPPRLRLQLKNVVMAHGKELFGKTVSQQDRQSKSKRHLYGHEAFRQACQRVPHALDWQYAAPMEICPCQLGIGDLDEFQVSCDPCNTTASSFDDLLRLACTCGRLSFKRHKKAEIG